MTDRPADNDAPRPLPGPSLAPPAAAPGQETTPTTAAIQAAPAAVKRSMPMALSLALGILLAALAGWLFYSLTWLILLVYLAFIAATVLEAPVQWLKRRGIRRGLGAVIVSLATLSLVLVVVYAVVTSLYGQASAVSANLTKAPERFNELVNQVKGHFPELEKHMPNFDIGAAVTQILPKVSTLFTNALLGFEFVGWLVVFFFLILYMLIDGADHLKAARTILPQQYRIEATRLFTQIAQAHRGWAVASCGNILSSALLTGMGLYFLGVPGALAFGLIAGFGELVPNVGPLLAALPAVVITLLAEPEKTVYVIGVLILIQTVQSYTLSPLMLRFSVQLPVLVTIIAAIVFGTLFGFLGILVSIPFVADLVVTWNYLNSRREQDTTDYDSANSTPTGQREAIPATGPHAL